jgi:hypothetical protein
MIIIHGKVVNNIMKFNKLILGLMVVAVFVGVWLLNYASDTRGSMASNVVISEIQISGQDGANDEFVELYNPTSLPVSIDGWRLRKTASNLGSALNIVDVMSGSIPAYGYYLIAHPKYTGITPVDQYYTATSSGIPANGIVYLYADAGTTLVDLVGLGSA